MSLDTSKGPEKAWKFPTRQVPEELKLQMAGPTNRQRTLQLLRVLKPPFSPIGSGVPVSRMASSRVPSTKVYSEIVNGIRHRRAWNRRFKDQQKTSLIQAWEREATYWRKEIHFSCSPSEERRKAEVEVQKQSQFRQIQLRPSPNLTCEQFLRLFRSRLGLLRHIWF